MVQGNLSRDVETFGKQDPYVTIHYGGVKYKTKIIDGGGKTPVWNHAFDIPIASASDDLQFYVKDNDVIGAKLIAQAVIKASALCYNNGVRDWFTVTYEGKDAGQILLETKFIPTHGAASGSSHPIPMHQPVAPVIQPGAILVQPVPQPMPQYPPMGGGAAS